MHCCAHPKFVKVPDYDCGNYLGTTNMRWIQVPCRKCIPCLEEYQKNLMCRLLMEKEISSTAYFITLTYDDDHLKELNKKDLQRFMNSLRQVVLRKNKTANIRYFACGEYGRVSNRPHYHMLLFNVPAKNLHEIYLLVSHYWQYGFVNVKYANVKTIAYITKYMTKLDPRTHEIEPFYMFSTRPGIGYNFFKVFPEVLDFILSSKKPVITFRGNYAYVLPRYFRDRYFPKELRRQIREFAESHFFNYDELNYSKDYDERKRKQLKRRYHG